MIDDFSAAIEANVNDEIDLISKDELQDESDKAIVNRVRLESNLSNIWGHSDLGLEAKKAAMSMLSTKNGMYARIPIICKKDKCPYADLCSLLKYDLAPIGEPCPKETAEIELRYIEYDKQFKLDSSSFTDKVLVSEIINYDIMLDRLKALLSKEQIMTLEVITGISEAGEEFTHPEVSKTWEAYERVSKKRDTALSQMLATRKDNKDNLDDASKTVMQTINDIISSDDFIVDVKPDSVQ